MSLLSLPSRLSPLHLFRVAPMMRKCTPLVLAAALLFSSVGCQEKKTKAQLNAEKEKVWRDQQKVRAAKYYQDLIEKFPDSPHVAEAKARLQALGPIATPAGAKPGASPKPGASASPKPKS